MDVGGAIGVGILAGWRSFETTREIKKRLKQTDVTIQLLKPLTQDIWPCENKRKLILIAQDDQAKILEPLAEQHNIELLVRPNFIAISDMRQWCWEYFQKHFHWYVSSDSHLRSFKKHPIYNLEPQLDVLYAEAFSSHIIGNIFQMVTNFPHVYVGGWGTRNCGLEFPLINGHQTTNPREYPFYVRNLVVARTDGSGFYPEGWNVLEDAHFILSTLAAGGGVVKFRDAELRSGATHSQAGLARHPEYNQRLIELTEIFGKKIVKRLIKDSTRGDQKRETSLYQSVLVGI